MRRTVLVACLLGLSGAANAQDAGLKQAIEANTEAVKALTANIGRFRRSIVVQTFSPTEYLRVCPTGTVVNCNTVAAGMCQDLGFQSGQAVQVGIFGSTFGLTNAICSD
jgi:hypothetical protein